MAKKKLLLVFVVMFGLILLPAFYVWETSPISSSSKEEVFVVGQGESTKAIAIRLKEKGLIKNSYFFIGEVYRLSLAGKIQAGSFRLSQSMSAGQIAKNLTSGKLDQWLTIVEGLRSEQVAFQVEEELSIDSGDFLAASLGKEGRLFPDSYLVPIGASAEKLVEMMLANFDKKTAGLKVLPQSQYSFDQLVVIASLVEREAKTTNDRRLVAGIIKKRLANDWPLQIDASSQYAKATANCRSVADCRWWPAVGSVDLETNSPYNTYLNKGLPPGPICNPSFSSLEAAFNHLDSDYWFYVSDSSGKIHFSKTYEEHQDNISKYL
jgi:UPF0755 protein